MKNKLTIYDNIAYNSRAGAQKFLNSYGMKEAKSTSQLSNKLESIVAKSGKPALLKLTKIHPDREIIIESAEIKSSASGSCPHKSFCGFVDDEIQDDVKTNKGLNIKDFIKKNQTALMITGVVVFGFMIFRKKGS